MDDDGYQGSAQLVPAGGAPVEVEVTLRGHFDPISGKYNWYGRVATGPGLTELMAAPASVRRALTLRTPHGQAPTALSDVDPWGRPRVEGFGRPPFPVLDTVADD